MAINLNDNIFSSSPKLLDAKWGPFPDLSTAYSSVLPSFRKIGMFAIISPPAGPAQLYWYKNDTTTLVPFSGNSSVEIYPAFINFPAIGSVNVIYIDKTESKSYYWNAAGGNYQLTDSNVEVYPSANGSNPGVDSFPQEGVENVIYIADDTNISYVWNIALNSGAGGYEILTGAGKGITSIARTAGDGSPGTTDTYTVTYSDTTTYEFFVYNGADGVGGGVAYYVDEGTITNSYAITTGNELDANTEGDTYLIKFKTPNTGTSTLSVDGIGDVPLINSKTQNNLLAGDITDESVHLVVYTTSQFEVTTIGGGGIGDMTKAVYDPNDTGIVLSSHKEMVAVINKTGSPVTEGTIVYLKSTSSSGSHPEILLADADLESTSSKTLGAVYETIANDATGYVVTSGEVDNLNTSMYNIGDKLWLSQTAGQVTTTPPTQPAHTVFIGTVTRSQNGNGRILYAIQNGYEINELHNVLITGTRSFGEYLYYDEPNSLWKNSNSWQGNTIPISKGGTNLTSLGTASQLLRVNSGATALEYFTITKSDVGLSAVENTAISTWAGSANITTLGTITTGTWNATSIAGNKQTVMVAATGIAAGTQGAVPQPLAGDNVKYLKGDGTWDTPVATASLSSLSAATTNATLTNANSTITWNWNSNTTANAFVFGSTGLTSGNLLTLGISGSAATSADNLVITNSSTVNTSGRGLDIAISGPTANAVTFGAVISNTKTATGTGVNTALQLTASGGTTNYALDVATGIVRLGQSTASVPHMLFTPGTAALTGSTNGMLSYATVSSNSSFYLWKDSAVTTIITKDRNPDFAVGSNYGVIISDASGNLSKSADLTALGIFSQTTTVTVNSLVTTNLLTGTIVGSNTLPANYFAAGKTLRLFLSGNIETASSAGSVAFNLTLGSTVLIATGDFTINTSITGAFTLEAIITCRTAGSFSDFKTSILVYSSNITPGATGPFTQSVYTNSASVLTAPINTTNSLQLLVNTTMTTSASTINVHNVYAEYIN